MTVERAYHYDLPKVAGAASELAIQKACRQMIAKAFPRTAVAAIPNGGKRTRWQQWQAKAEGISKGFPDLVLIGPGAAAFIEIKAKSALDPAQHDWLDHLHRNGHRCGVFRSPETLYRALKEWGFS